METKKSIKELLKLVDKCHSLGVEELIHGDLHIKFHVERSSTNLTVQGHVPLVIPELSEGKPENSENSAQTTLTLANTGEEDFAEMQKMLDDPEGFENDLVSESLEQRRVTNARR